MNSYYKQLVATLGEAGAKEYMRSLRAKRKSPGHFATVNKKTLRQYGKKGGLKAAKNVQPEKQLLQDEQA